MSTIRISAIIPLWNGEQLLETLLDSLSCQTLAPAEILVVDNGSTDGGPALALRRGARVISMGYNAGFAGAVNRGIAEASAEWIGGAEYRCHARSRLFRKAGRRAAPGSLPAGFCRQRDPSRLDATFDLLSRAATSWRAGHGAPYDSAFRQTRAISSAPWTAVLFRTEIFRRVGMLETSFESYLEDVDFGLRSAALGSRASMCRRPSRITWAVRRWGAGTPAWCGASPATRCFCWRGTIRGACCFAGFGRFWRANRSGAWWHCGMEPAWPGAGERCEGLWRFRACVPAPNHSRHKSWRTSSGPRNGSFDSCNPRAGRDLYWRLYFLLTGSGAE